MTEYGGDGTAKTREDYDFEPWHTALDELPASVIEKQSADVDVITGATGTSNKFIQAVERALEQAL
ncbi:MAG: FMN-binding protein [Bacillota bacterium]|nr:FMN-binding protein [Bacillota bacterium]